jgi:hypothetical protein
MQPTLKPRIISAQDDGTAPARIATGRTFALHGVSDFHYRFQRSARFGRGGHELAADRIGLGTGGRGGAGRSCAGKNSRKGKGYLP